MSLELPQCRITVLKRTIHQDLIEEHLDESYGPIGLCECFEDGQEFVVDPSGMAEDIFSRCPWAWADIRHDILTVAYGGDMPGMKRPGTLITGWTDWLRPVLFKVERLDR